MYIVQCLGSLGNPGGLGEAGYVDGLSTSSQVCMEASRSLAWLKRLLSISSEFTLSTLKLVRAHRQPLNFSRAGERTLVRHRDGPELCVSKLRFTNPSRYLSYFAHRVHR